MSITEGENVSSLKSLIEVSKNVVDHDNGLLSVDGTSNICSG